MDEVVKDNNNLSDRWWMEVPYPNKTSSKYDRHVMIPCSYDEYLESLNNVLPELWWRTYEKLT